MKKIMAMFMMVLLVLSATPLVLADADNATDAIGSDSGDDITNTGDTTVVSDDSDASDSLEDETELRVKLDDKERLALKKAGIPKKRVILDRKLKVLRQDYVEAKSDYLEARANYLDKKKAFVGAKKKWNGCKNDDSVECVQIRKETKRHAKQFLLNSADMVLNTLEKLKSKIQASEDMTEEEVSEALSEIEEKITEITELKVTIEALNGESTKEEIHEVRDSIKTIWKSTKKVIKVRAGVLVNKRMGGIIVQSERLSIKLSRAIDRLEAKGYDISGIEDLEADFDAKLAEAKDNYEIAQEKYEAAKDTTSFDLVIREAHNYLVKAHNDLKDARVILRQIIKTIKETEKEDEDVLGEEDDEDESADDEEVEEEEIEDDVDDSEENSE